MDVTGSTHWLTGLVIPRARLHKRPNETNAILRNADTGGKR
jgi:hypothetical protein